MSMLEEWRQTKHNPSYVAISMIPPFVVEIYGEQIAPHILWNQGYTIHKKSHDVVSYTMHTKMSMLEEWRQTKASIVTLTTSTIFL